MVRRRARTEFTVLSVLVYVAAAALLLVPAFSLATGVEAIGADLGWWRGDPDANDNAAFIGTAVGLVSAVVVLMAAAAILRELGRRYQLPARAPAGIGIAVILVGLVALCIGVVAA